MSNADKAMERAAHAGEVARSGNTAPKSIAGFLNDPRVKQQIALALPAHVTPDRLVRMAMTQLRVNPKLGECSLESFAGALFTAAQLGLEPGPLGECWMIPRWSGKLQVTECTFQTGYQGYAKLAHNSGQIRSLYAYAVYDGDEFDYGLGDEPYVHHKPDPDRTSESDDAIKFFYGVENLVNGGKEIEVWSKAHMDAHRDLYVKKDKYGKFPATWVKSYSAMGRKTMISVVARRGPRSVELAAALSADGNVRTSLTRDMVFIPEDTPDVFNEQAAEVVDPVSGEVIDSEATEDETGQDGTVTAEAPSIAPKTLQKLAIALKDMDEDTWRAHMKETYEVDSRKKLSENDGQAFLAWAVFTKDGK